MNQVEQADVIVIGSGMGGACTALALAPTGARVLILECGHQLPEHPANRDARAIFQHGHFRTRERWYDVAGRPFVPGNYYYHGGNTKLYGAVLMRYRAEDFDGPEHLEGRTPVWPFRYGELAPWYQQAEQLFQVRGELGGDPTEPAHQGPYPYPAVPDEPAIAQARERLRRVGLHPSSLPLGIDIERWLAVAPTGWDAFPDARCGKMDAENCALVPALAWPDVRLESGAEVLRLLTAADGRRIERVEYRQDGVLRQATAKLVVLAAGAIRSAKILLASREGGLANRSDAVGRHFMNHNLTGMLAFDPSWVNDSVYQKTFALNDFYFDDGRGGAPLGHVQLVGRVDGAIMKSFLPWAPEGLLGRFTRHTLDLLLMSEDLPNPDSRVRLDGERLVLDWRRSNLVAHRSLRRRMDALLRQAGFRFTVSRPFDRSTTSHQCGTIRIGDDPTQAPLDPWGRAFDHPNLFVCDASTLVTSAAVNPSLTVAAMALRTADHIRRSELGG